VPAPVLLLPRPVDQFVLGDHAQELIDTAGASVALPGRVPYGALLRARGPARTPLVAAIARELRGQIERESPPGVAASDRILIAYHAIQWPVIEKLLGDGVAGTVWYCRWDRYEAAADAGGARKRLSRWNRALAARSSLTFCVSERLAQLEREAGREAIVVGLSADSFPRGPLEPGLHGKKAISIAAQRMPGDGAPIAVSLGHLGRRTDWAWLRTAVERVPQLSLLLIGAWHEEEVGENPDYRWLREQPRVVWLGPLEDGDAAAVIAHADVGLVPFLRDDFNNAGLPTRILKYARLGRPTLAPPLTGAQTWERATTFVRTPDELVDALHLHTGRRHQPDLELRRWALDQTAAKMNQPLHAALAE
jgi:hypothetical protein